MANTSKIEWTDASWNPVTGCSKISPGCLNCYAERLSKRLQSMGNANYAKGFRLTTHPNMLDIPLTWKRPRMIFVNSMSDLFHEEVPLDFILQVFQTMEKANWHTFQILTKRSSRILELNKKLHWPENVWVGVSVENQEYTYRIEHLQQIDAHIKFISFEPLLGPIKSLHLNSIDWIIVGGESGPNARPIVEKWICDIRDQCLFKNVPFFFKQWGGKNKKRNGRLLQGKIWDETPETRELEYLQI
ncbi:MAG: phage Gp37/Gp68 family protein [Candidatus Latescibacteria bacterium]|nr:phage Gp37/Gp68 family protein [Candidatus Latescibacterota bacterium]